MRKRSVVFIRHEGRDLPSTKGLLLSFPAWKKVPATLNPFEWHHDKEASYRPDEGASSPFPWNFLTGRSAVSIMPPLPDPRRHCCISSNPPPPVCFHIYSLTHPTILLISTRLPSVTGPTLKSHQSSLLCQEPRHQRDSFCLNGTMAAGPAIVAGLTLRSNPIDEEEGQ